VNGITWVGIGISFEWGLGWYDVHRDSGEGFDSFYQLGPIMVLYRYV